MKLMKRTDEHTLDMLREEFAKSAESAKVPLRLQKESVVTMLKNSADTADKEEKDFSVKTGYKNSIVKFGRLGIAAAVMIAIVAVAASNMRMGGVRVIKTDSFYESYKGLEPVRSVNSYEDVEKAVIEILDGKKAVENKSPQSEKPSDKKDGVTQAEKNSVIEGYSEYVAQANVKRGNADVADLPITQAVQGVVPYGDFKADIVKSNGEYLYIVTTCADEENGGTLEQIKIIKAVPAGEMQVVSTIALSDGKHSETVDECIEIYLKNNTLIALMSRYSYSSKGAYGNVSTVAAYYDISNPAAPVKTREHVQDGSYVTSGLYGTQFSLVTDKTINVAEGQGTLSRDDVIPSFSINALETKLDAEDIFIAVNDPEPSYLFVTATDASDANSNVGKLAILGCGKEVYCSANAFAVARGFVSVDADKNGEHTSFTEIYRFNISGSSIAFAQSYVVNGTLAGAISIDEESGYIRVATADGEANNFYIFNEKMEFVSGLTGVFPNEKITSVKFIGSNAYFVAGADSENTMIVDISNPEKPKVAGKIPTEGFSHELYALSDTALLGICASEGRDTTITLFDVSDPESPAASSVYTLGAENTILSDDDNRCVMINREKNIFGVPVVIQNKEEGTEISAYILFAVADGNITPVGTYNHENSYTGDAAVRGTCIGETLYTVSGERIVAFSIDECKAVSSLEIG